MSTPSYPTDINTISTDIDAVGGKNATEWMIREDTLGKKYLLVKAGGNIANGLIVGINISELITMPTGYEYKPLGVNTTGSAVSTNDYFWLQVYGVGLCQTDNSVVKHYYIAAQNGDTGLGVGAGAGAYGKHYVGWALETDYGSNPYWVSIFIDPFSGHK